MSHTYDRFLDSTADRRINGIKNRKNWVQASSDKISWWDWNVKITIKVLVVIYEFLTCIDIPTKLIYFSKSLNVAF